jgi:hypothetical protein
MQLQSTQVIKAQYAVNGAIIVLWVLSALLWLASLFGSYIPFAAGPEAALRGPDTWPPFNIAAFGVSFAYQIIASITQWGAFAMHKRNSGGGWLMVGIMTLLISGVPSFLTYWGWAGGMLTEMTWGMWFIAAPILAIAVLLGDRIPEWVCLKG